MTGFYYCRSRSFFLLVIFSYIVHTVLFKGCFSFSLKHLFSLMEMIHSNCFLVFLLDCAVYLYPPLKCCLLSRACYIVPQSGWSGLLCIHGITTENNCGGGRWEVAGSSVSLSWHPLQNNWMAYQVTTWGLITLFHSWLSEIPTLLQILKRNYLVWITEMPCVMSRMV